MIITKQSPLTGIINSRDLPVTQDQLDRWRTGTLAQDAFPHLSPDDREFIITGATKEDWARMFPPEEL
jgi:hypothetical protein